MWKNGLNARRCLSLLSRIDCVFFFSWAGSFKMLAANCFDHSSCLSSLNRCLMTAQQCQHLIRQVLLSWLYSVIDSNRTKPVSFKSWHSPQGRSCQFITVRVIKTPPKNIPFPSSLFGKGGKLWMFFGSFIQVQQYHPEAAAVLDTAQTGESSCPKGLRGWKDNDIKA